MQISRNGPTGPSTGNGRPVLMRQADKEKDMRILDAIQEQYGPRYATLEDALNWWTWPEHWRGGLWNDHVLGISPSKTAFESHLKKE